MRKIKYNLQDNEELLENPTIKELENYEIVKAVVRKSLNTEKPKQEYDGTINDVKINKKPIKTKVSKSKK